MTAVCKKAFLTIGLLSTGFISHSASATSFYSQPFPETVQAAPIIVRGKTGMSTSDWSQEGGGMKKIYTFYEFQPTEVLKGNLNPSASITLRELGGEKDGIGLTVPGVAQFEKGEDAVVFLKNKNATGTYDVQGMMMGKYGLQKDADGEEYLTGMGLNTFDNFSNPLNNNAGNNVEGTARSPAMKRKWTLPDLRTLIRTQAKGIPPEESNTPPHHAYRASNRIDAPPSSPSGEPSPQTLSAVPPIESSDTTPSDFSKYWIPVSMLIGLLGLWRYSRAHRKK